MSTNFFPKHIRYLAAFGTSCLLCACGGGGGPGTGYISVGVTDVPVTEDVDVCIHFTHVTLHHSDGERIEIPYDASTYDDATDCINNVLSGVAGSENNAVALSALQGELSVALMESEVVKAGVYTWIRLYVDETLSYVMDSEGMKDLSCPSCDSEQSGLKLNRSIVVPAGGEADFMIDIDLAKSLNKDPSGLSYRLRPTLRLVNLAETGTISGSVLESLIPGMISDEDTGCKVYVYEGHGVIPDDYHDTDNVLTSAKVLYDSVSSTYEYVAAFLPTDNASDTPYTVALTCDSDDMKVNQNNDSSIPTADDVIFTDGATDGMGQEVVLSTGETKNVPF